MKRNGFVLRFDPDGHGKVIAGPFGYANGLALSEDERFLFLVESDSDSIMRFEVDPVNQLPKPEIYATKVGRLPDGLALDANGNLWVCCYASDEIWRVDTDRRMSLIAHDRWAIKLSRPTNLVFGGNNHDEIYVANLGRQTITRFKTQTHGQPLANLQVK
jgi:gluconolactonase